MLRWAEDISPKVSFFCLKGDGVMCRSGVWQELIGTGVLLILVIYHMFDEILEWILFTSTAILPPSKG